MAKSGQMEAVKIMAKDLVRTRNFVKKFILMRANIQAISLKIQTLKSQAAMANAMKGKERVLHCSLAHSFSSPCTLTPCFIFPHSRTVYTLLTHSHPSHLTCLPASILPLVSSPHPTLTPYIVASRILVSILPLSHLRIHTQFAHSHPSCLHPSSPHLVYLHFHAQPGYSWAEMKSTECGGECGELHVGTHVCTSLLPTLTPILISTHTLCPGLKLHT